MAPLPAYMSAVNRFIYLQIAALIATAYSATSAADNSVSIKGHWEDYAKTMDETLQMRSSGPVGRP